MKIHLKNNVIFGLPTKLDSTSFAFRAKYSHLKCYYDTSDKAREMFNKL